MMKWSRLCFLVLTVSTMSRGRADESRNEHDIPSHTTTMAPAAPPASGGSGPLNETENNISAATRTPPPSVSLFSENATDGLSANSVTGVDNESNTTEGGGSGAKTSAATVASTTLASMKDGAGHDVAMVSTATRGSTKMPGITTEMSRASSWGYVVLVLIILVIIVLCIILYFLRRVSRTYSFDLQRPDPIINQFNEPTGTGFEPVYLDDLDRPAPRDDVITNDLSPPPVSNGTSLQVEEKDSDGENAPDPQPEANGIETSPPSNTSPSSGDDPADITSDPPSSTDLIFDATGETQQNENNNNPSIFSTNPFVEINLDEPAWSDQLLTPPLATSSVLPFSPFSFSSSSSS